jgi:DNA helicase II / ATP-dependent DNA helicase PcrA
MDTILAELNPSQRSAVETVTGPLLIIAGPGSGKTRVITHRIAYLIRICGINPYRILAVTFTNKAAREMKERLDKLLGQTAENLTMGTFHSICARILRQEGRAIGIEPNYTIYDDEDQISLIKQSIQDVGLDPKQYTPKSIQSAISFAKSQLLTPADFARNAGSYHDEIVKRVYERYHQMMEKSQTLDFDDLLMKTVQLFNTHADVLNKYQNRYLHVLVDEFQDTNITQYELIKQLAGKHRNICVVGDPDQSIYSWRHADIRNILSFEKDFPDAGVVVLEENYRSTQTILDVATSLIAVNVNRKPKELHTENEAGVPVSVIQTYTQDDEAQYVVKEIDRLINYEKFAPSDCAVMYRVNAQSRALEEAFVRHGMAYKLVGGTRFYQRREVKDIIAYLRVIHNRSDNVSLTRIINVPNRAIGTRTVAELAAWSKEQNISMFTTVEQIAEKQGPPLASRAVQSLTGFLAFIRELIASGSEATLSKLIEEIVVKSGYRDYISAEEKGDDRWENVQELRDVAREYDGLPIGEALPTFLEQVSLVADVDELDEKVETTVLTTLHQAKGLEFPVVFIVGMEEGLLPHNRSLDSQGELEEERRLCYVGITRAKKRVYLLHAVHRNLYGSSSNDRSRFLDDIPEHLINKQSLWDKGDQSGDSDSDYTPVIQLFSKPKVKQPVPSGPPPVKHITLGTGDRVRHATFGDGTVINAVKIGEDQQVTVNFDGSGIKRLLLSYAPLEKI